MGFSPPPLRILARPAFGARTNPYTSALYAPLVKAGHTVQEYRWDRAMTGQWDVVHVHWPESVFNHTFFEAWITTEGMLVALDRARHRGAKVVWTVHNLRAHERRHERAEQRFRARFFERLDGIVTLSESGLEAARTTYPRLTELPAWVVPHPHYRGRYPDTVTREEARRSLGLSHGDRVILNFGRVFEYKNVPALFSAVKQAPDEAWVVVVAGRPRTTELAEELRRAAADESRIRLAFEFIDDARVQLYFRAADVVVLPYREILNSGTALLALSFDRPVLLPRAGAGEELVKRVGGDWAFTYDGELSAEDVRAALRKAADLPERTAGEHLERYSHEAVGEEMTKAFREVVSR